LRVLKFGKSLKSGEECGCGFKHDRTLDLVLLGPISEALGMLEDLRLKPPYAVFYDETTYRVAGRFVKEKLAAKGVLTSSPTFQEAERGLAEARGARTVIGVGGGTVIDLAKYAAYRLEADFISIPTAPSHDGMVSPVVSLFKEGRRKSILARSPRLAIIDLRILGSAPRQLLISGYGDILAKIISIKDWQLGRDERGEQYCKTAESLVISSLEELIASLRKPSPQEETFETLVKALINSGAAMMVVGTSRPASGSEHLISHYLDMNLKERLPHGIQCALGTLLMAAYHELRNPNWWKDERYRLNALRGYFREVGLPTSLREAGVPIGVMVDAVVEAWRIRPKRYTILHKFKPDRSEALKLLRISGLA